MPLTRTLTSSWSPKHNVCSTRVKTAMWSLSSQKGTSQFVIVVGFNEGSTGTFTLHELFPKGQTLRTVTVCKVGLLGIFGQIAWQV
jgi:hypothetical protein